MNSWEDLHGVMPNKSVKEYASVYASPEDLDLWTAGVTERPLPGELFLASSCKLELKKADVGKD